MRQSRLCLSLLVRSLLIINCVLDLCSVDWSPNSRKKVNLFICRVLFFLFEVIEGLREKKEGESLSLRSFFSVLLWGSVRYLKRVDTSMDIGIWEGREQHNFAGQSVSTATYQQWRLIFRLSRRWLDCCSFIRRPDVRVDSGTTTLAADAPFLSSVDDHFILVTLERPKIRKYRMYLIIWKILKNIVLFFVKCERLRIWNHNCT